MDGKTLEIPIDHEGFITPAKGLNQMMLSLLIWFFTGLIYKVCTIAMGDVQYELVCFLSSISLSTISGILISRKLLVNESAMRKVIYGFLNILLLYTSANGIQAAYCFGARPDQIDANIKAAFIPLPLAKPWLPDLFHISIIKDLRNGNESLRADTSGASSTITGDEIQLMNMRLLQDENSTLKAQLDSCRQAQQPASQDYQPDVNDLYEQVRILQGRINEFNNRQAIWSKAAGLDEGRVADIRGDVNSIVRQIDPNDNDFYEFIFNTPIDANPFQQQQKGP